MINRVWKAQLNASLAVALRAHSVSRTGCIHHQENKRTAQVRALVASQRCYL